MRVGDRDPAWIDGLSSDLVGDPFHSKCFDDGFDASFGCALAESFGDA